MTADPVSVLLVFILPVLFVFWMIRDARRSLARPEVCRPAKDNCEAIPRMNQDDLGDGLFPGGIGGTG